jgi:peptide/nickel transport system substrate-binding protein
VQLDAIRADRAATDFRGYPPSAIEQLKEELGDKIVVSRATGTAPWGLDQPPAKAVRRRAGASRVGSGTRPLGQRAGPLSDKPHAHRRQPRLSGITVGTRQRPAQQNRRLLARHREVTSRGAPAAEKAGAEGLSFELVNRDVDQPYKYLGIWLIDQWCKIGLHVTQNVVPTGPWFAALRSGDLASRPAAVATASRV